MQREISIAGTGQTKFGELWDKNIRDLMDEAVANAITAAGCTALDIDTIVVANMLAEVTNGQAHLGALASSLLPHHPPAIRVEAACGSGAAAVHTACAFLESGRAQTVLVVGVEKMTDVSVADVSSALMGAADSERERPAGLTFPGMFGLIATRYMHEYGLTREDLNLVSAVHHRNAVANPFAQFRSEIAPDAVSRSTRVADPLCLLDCSPVSDGAAACILSTTLRGDVRIAASQIATDQLCIADRPTITAFSASQEAMEHALAEASVKRSEIAAIETHDCFSIAALINLEDLGFADPGRAIEIYRGVWEGHTDLGVNRSGGLKGCGHPVAATGIKQINDIAKQLTVSGHQWGVAHNFGGAASTAGVHILEYVS